ncbi:cation:proton antiporter [Candidatus Laterigemmans baculatus]|uniref:cation:proton antiporter n=1 Tax=Candidatus Laterigemmans baculatus TaxID=2770505 RepID=UPI0013DBE64E|nr:sodium:proton antiporter [Candidatus Laterigemmans baculatus]
MLLYYVALVPALGVAAQWIAWRLHLPGILMLLIFGIILGQFLSPDEVIAGVTGGDASSGTRVLFPLVSLSVAVILFEGSLTLRLGELREAGSAVLRLVTIGAVVTCLMTTLAAHWFLDFSWRVSLLIGSILTVTGPTVITPLLHHIRPTRRISSTLKWEGIVIDPIGAVLAVLVFEELLLPPSVNPWSAALSLGKTVLVGLVLGAAGAGFLVQCIRRFWVPDYLQGILALAVALVSFCISNYLAEESGLITVTLLGIILANQKQAVIEHLIEFKEHLRTLLIGCLFILLGSRIDPQALLDLGWPGVGLVLFLIAVIRPASAFISLAGTQLDWREKVFVGFLAPRGIVAAAVASVFALKLEQLADESGMVDSATPLVSATFLVILSTVTFYGLVSGPLARVLGLAIANPQGLLFAGADHWVRELAKVLHENGVRVMLVDTNYNKISAARMAGLPAECINVLSDQARNEVNLGGIGRMLAVTPNDEVNSLAVQEFRQLFESSGVFQLPFKSHAAADSRSPASHLQARVLFGSDWTFTRIRETVAAGAVFKATKLSDNFSYSDFLVRYGDQAVLMFVIQGETLQVNTVDQKLNPEPGSTVVALVPALPIPPGHAASSEPKAVSSSDSVPTSS